MDLDRVNELCVLYTDKISSGTWCGSHARASLAKLKERQSDLTSLSNEG